MAVMANTVVYSDADVVFQENIENLVFETNAGVLKKSQEIAQVNWTFTTKRSGIVLPKKLNR